MYKDRPKIGLIVQVRKFRKSKGGRRDGRSGSTGKILEAFEDNNGTRGKRLYYFKGPTFAHVSKDFRNAANIPTYVRFSRDRITHI